MPSPPTIRRLLVTCRGEIAVRIVRAARELGIHTIAAHSKADAESLAVRLADEAVLVGPSPASKSYLDADALLDAARRTDADAVHPGYGFLSENAGFARAVTDAGLVWVGPDAETIATMGDKAAAIATARAAGVPVVPGSDGLVADAEEAVAAAEPIGFPVLVKASAGGGGRGIRVAEDADELRTEVRAAQEEARAAFGDPSVYLERQVRDARHIEVQVLGDGERVVHFFERDCSLQRRRQKVWEEAPAAALDDETRTALCSAAVALADSVSYRGAGTVEFLYEPGSGAFFFIEMNTRIQVEHPITEMVCGVDLIRAMLRIAAGQPLPWSQADVAVRGHAIEVRINAEDPDDQFTPSPGLVEGVSWPQGPGVRVDAMAFDGATVPPFYDSLVAKLVVWDEDRPAALERLERALAETEVRGVATTLGFFARLLAEPDVRENRVHTRWIEDFMTEPDPAPDPAQDAVDTEGVSA